MSILKASPLHKLVILVASLGFLAGMTALATPGEAREIQWCSRDSKRGTVCMYHTEQQCRAAISGRGGTCVRRRV
ncbi:MAG: DUF3551 domain-containing protein [Bradyrhizobium sp.]|nr:DUF3551 domain-containing protein [Acidobacteriota bacterium]MBV9980081.1 DUF3551 domain-containing protein [Bradyrhizobium sp.]